ncbi:G-patch domain-containing protein [Fusarium oxysporum f. sp. albedinis]|nr:G-patch domain-containing protein [Fusarium oxysporum f. sp. albedinis]
MNLLFLIRDWVVGRDPKPSQKVAHPQTHGPRPASSHLCHRLLFIHRQTHFAMCISDATEHAKVVFGRCPSLPTALPHSCFSPEKQPND